MQNRILGLRVQQSEDKGEKLQQTLTKYGCAIRTRIGLNKDDNTTDEGIILLEIAPEEDPEEVENLKKTLKSIQGVDLKEMIFE